MKPVLVIGSKVRAAGAEKEVIQLADALGCSVAVMAAAKGFFPGRSSAICRNILG